MIRSLLRVTAYPVVFGLSFWAVLEIVARPAWQWPGLAAVALVAMTVVAALEWVIPYQRAWRSSRCGERPAPGTSRIVGTHGRATA